MISVIIPVYNAEKLLTECLDSLSQQRYRDVEVILVNDGSTDNSGELCNAFARQHARVTVIHRNNGGPGAARNSGLEAMTGDHVFFLDADDFIPDDALLALTQAMQSSGADLVIGEFVRIRNNENIGCSQICGNPETDAPRLDEDGITAAAIRYLDAPNRHLLFAYPWGRLYDAKIIKEHQLRFKENIVNCEDVAFNFDFLAYAKSLYLLDQPVYFFTIHNNTSSLTMHYQKRPERLFGFLGIFTSITHFAAAKGLDVQKHLGQYCITMTIISLTRMGCSLSFNNLHCVYGFVSRLVNHPDIRKALPYYSRPPGGSLAVPKLIQWKCPSLLTLVSWYKGIKRYGKNGSKRS